MCSSVCAFYGPPPMDDGHHYPDSLSSADEGQCHGVFRSSVLSSSSAQSFFSPSFASTASTASLPSYPASASAAAAGGEAYGGGGVWSSGGSSPSDFPSSLPSVSLYPAPVLSHHSSAYTDASHFTTQSDTSMTSDGSASSAWSAQSLHSPLHLQQPHSALRSDAPYAASVVPLGPALTGAGGCADLSAPSSPFRFSAAALRPSASFLSLARLMTPVDPHLLSSLFSCEQSYQPSPFYLHGHAHLDASMRPVLFDWLMEVAAEFRLQRETLHLAINFIERFLTIAAANPSPAARPHTGAEMGPPAPVSPLGGVVVIHKANYQLLGIACLFVACKVEESRPPRAEDLARTTDGACSAAAICELERCVLQTLQWRLHPITSAQWMKALLGLAVRRLHSLLVESLTQHFQQSPHCGERLQALADLDDPLQSLASSPCAACSSLYLQFHEDLHAFLSLAAFHAAAQLCDLATFDVASLHYYPSSVAAAALLVAHSVAPSRLRLVCEVSGYSMEVLAGLLHALHRWQLFPVQARQGGDEEEQTCLQVHYRGALDRWKATQRNELVDHLWAQATHAR